MDFSANLRATLVRLMRNPLVPAGATRRARTALFAANGVSLRRMRGQVTIDCRTAHGWAGLSSPRGGAAPGRARLRAADGQFPVADVVMFERWEA